MQLVGNLYNIVSREKNEDSNVFHIHLNADHFIYKAHFPGKPITPGVCIIQIIEELVSVILSRKVMIQSVKNIKFITILQPTSDNDISVKINEIKSIDENSVKVQAIVYDSEQLFAKLSINLKLC